MILFRRRILSKKDEKMIKDALERGDNIIITGLTGVGKTTYYKEIIRLSLTSAVHKEYIFVDEVTSPGDIEWINERLGRSNTKIVFTAHYASKSDIKDQFPAFTGMRMHIIYDRETGKRRFAYGYENTSH